MGARAIFDELLGDPNYKLLIDEDTVGAVKTTYIGKSDYKATAAALTSEPVWQIIKFTETTTGADVDTERFCPIDADGFVNTRAIFVWDDRATTITYA